MEPGRQERYFALIDQLLACPSGQEPDILDAESDLLDAGFIQALMQVATAFAHQNNSESAQFLIFLARQLARQLDLYPEVPTEA